MAEKTKLWYLEHFNLFSMMDERSMMEMDQLSKMKKVQKKEIIFFPDEPNDLIYFLKEGKVKLSRIAQDGRSATMQLIGPGEIFGESALLGMEKHENIAEVVEDAAICSMHKDLFLKFMNENSNLNLTVHKIIGLRLRKIQSALEDLVFKTAEKRIKHFLKNYVQDYGKPMLDGWMVRPFLKHQEIADLTATARQTVNAVLNDLAAEGIIQYQRKYLHIKDLTLL